MVKFFNGSPAFGAGCAPIADHENQRWHNFLRGSGWLK
jgi:hypothetical protein